jgi:hypothetical protein
MGGMDSHGALPDDLTAVVIDTNAMPDGRLDLGGLRSLPTALSSFPDAEIWIPEPVLWEWASHAQQDYDDAVVATNSAARRLERAGAMTQLHRIGDAARHDVRALLIDAVSTLPPPFRVVRLAEYPEVAAEALRRQVLQVPPAKRRSGVKTGAADTAVLLLAEAVHGELREERGAQKQGVQRVEFMEPVRAVIVELGHAQRAVAQRVGTGQADPARPVEPLPPAHRGRRRLRGIRVDSRGAPGRLRSGTRRGGGAAASSGLAHDRVSSSGGNG